MVLNNLIKFRNNKASIISAITEKWEKRLWHFIAFSRCCKRKVNCKFRLIELTLNQSTHSKCAGYTELVVKQHYLSCLIHITFSIPLCDSYFYETREKYD